MNKITAAENSMEFWKNALSLPSEFMQAGMYFTQAKADLFGASFHYFKDFLGCLAEGSELLANQEFSRLINKPQEFPKLFQEWCSLGDYNLRLLQMGWKSGIEKTFEAGFKNANDAFWAFCNSLVGVNSGKDLLSVAKRSAKSAKLLNELPAGIEAIGPEYGIHLKNGGYKEVARTPRSKLFLVLPLDKHGLPQEKLINWQLKPILVGPPQVLGANILAFLPKLGKSYLHSFANEGIPTFVVLMNDIKKCEAVQTMTPDDDCLDFVHYARSVKEMTGKKATINGYCQRGFAIAGHFMSGALDGLSDAFFSCVAPFDGTKSRELRKFLNDLPPRYRKLVYGTLTYPNGNKVASGSGMAFVYKIKALGGREFPLSVLYRDLELMKFFEENGKKPSPTVYALNRWLLGDRSDIPLAVTEESYRSYTEPITSSGILPIKRFGKHVSFEWFRRHPEILFKLFYAVDDDLVETEVAKAPLEYGAVKEEDVHDLERGHVAAATTPKNKNQKNGPLYWQLQLSK